MKLCKRLAFILYIFCKALKVLSLSIPSCEGYPLSWKKEVRVVLCPPQKGGEGYPLAREKGGEGYPLARKKEVSVIL